MKNRAQRLLLIENIISEFKIGSQDELLARLRKLGVNTTQSTLSRDMRALRVVKAINLEHGYIYQLPKRDLAPAYGPAPAHIKADLLANGFVRVEFSKNLGVIKTIPGYASSIAAAIDKAKLFELLGTVAGDDTILLILREGVERSDVISGLAPIIPGLEDDLT